MKHLLKLLLFGMIFGCTSCGNRLTINCKGLDSNDIEIYLSPGRPLQHNDNQSIKYEYLTLIYKNGVYYDIPNEYGENDWVINYKNYIGPKLSRDNLSYKTRPQKPTSPSKCRPIQLKRPE